MRTTKYDRQVFEVDQAGYLCRHVRPESGKDYTHRCSLASFERVCHAVDEARETGTTVDELSEAEGMPISRVATALAFLDERSSIEQRGRRNYPGSSYTSVYLDGMLEYHALAAQCEKERRIAALPSSPRSGACGPQSRQPSPQSHQRGSQSHQPKALGREVS